MAKKPPATPMPEEFNPNSYTAQIATLIAKQDALKDAIMARLDTQDATLGRIEAQATRTNGRVSVLERWKATTKAKVAVAAAAIGGVVSFVGWLVQTYIGLKGS